MNEKEKLRTWVCGTTPLGGKMFEDANGPYVKLDDVKAVLEAKQAELRKYQKCATNEDIYNAFITVKEERDNLREKLRHVIEAGKELKICAENQSSNLCCKCKVDGCALHEHVTAFDIAINILV